jgi:hypothetical protein
MKPYILELQVGFKKLARIERFSPIIGLMPNPSGLDAATDVIDLGAAVEAIARLHPRLRRRKRWSFHLPAVMRGIVSAALR